MPALAATAIALGLMHGAAAAEIEVRRQGRAVPRRPALGRRCPLLRRVWRSHHPARRCGRCGWPRSGSARAAGRPPWSRPAPDFLVTCYDENTLVRVSPAGETLQVYDKDAAGAAFIGPNDFVADDAGRRVHVGVRPVGDGTDRRQDPLPRPGRHPADGRRRPSLRQRPGPLARRQDALLLGDVRLSDRRLRRRREWQPHQPPRVRPRRRHRRWRPAAGARRPEDRRQGQSLHRALRGRAGAGGRSDAGKLLATIDPPAPNVSNVAFGPDQSVLYVTGVLDASAPHRGRARSTGSPIRSPQ